MSDITPNDLAARVAVPEEIASSTKQILTEIRADLRDLRSGSRSDYRWLMGLMLRGFGACSGSWRTGSTGYDPRMSDNGVRPWRR
jgi:hypothetical protein